MDAEKGLAVSTCSKQRVKVAFPVGDGDGQAVEKMYAVLRADGSYFLDNSPFLAFGISYADIFLAKYEDGELSFSEVKSYGGHSTYRVKLPQGAGHGFFLERWPDFEKLGCTYEGSSSGPERLYSIDIPVGVEVSEVYRLLQAAEDRGDWVFEEGHYFDPKKQTP